MKLENMQKNVLIKCFEIIKCNARAQEREREKTAESESDKHTPYSLFLIIELVATRTLLFCAFMPALLLLLPLLLLLFKLPCAQYSRFFYYYLVLCISHDAHVLLHVISNYTK